MDHGYRLHGVQQTIPSMLRKRGVSSLSTPASPMNSSFENLGVYCQQQGTISTPRMTPYKVPFQHRPVAETLYADSAPMIIPQPLQLSSPYGIGTVFGGATSLYIPNFHQNVIGSSQAENFNDISLQKEIIMKNEQDTYVTGLTSSPPNHPLPKVALAEVKNFSSPTQITSNKNVKHQPANMDSKSNCLQGDQSENKKNTTLSSSLVKQPFDPSRTALKVLTGSIEKVIKWERMWENKMDKPSVLFEIIAPLLQLKACSNPIEKQLLLREPGGSVLTVIYYEIDRMVPQLTNGECVRCVCRSLGKRRYQAFSIRPASQKERSSLERLSFICHQAVQKVVLSVPEPYIV